MERSECADSVIAVADQRIVECHDHALQFHISTRLDVTREVDAVSFTHDLMPRAGQFHSTHGSMSPAQRSFIST